MVAAVLAGGRATRLGGRDKGALLVGGRTILEREVGELRLVSPRILLVTSGPAHPGVPGVEIVADLVPGCGPLGGLYTALTAARDAVLVVASDLPFLRAPFLAHLVAAAATGFDAVVPRTPDGLHPLCAVYQPRALSSIAARLEQRCLKLVDLMTDLHVCEIPPEVVARFDPDGRLLLNVNTEAEYARAQALAGAS